MDKYKKLSDQLKGFNQTKTSFYPAIVQSVEGNTCTVKIDSILISEVKLQATSAALESKILLIPKLGTSAIVGSYSGDLSNLFIVKVDEIDKIELSTSGQNLMSLLSDFMQTLSGATVVVGKTTGKFTPEVIEKLNSIETKFKKIFK